MNAKKKKSKPSNLQAERDALKADIRKKIKKPEATLVSSNMSDEEREEFLDFEDKDEQLGK